ncbi:ArsR family transcriptional regulator [Halosimplex carlsbadense 2-9-1]|uniref:ArsR family transcriptional regulator n=1 Tax=Halosimplex carlsbadense 2-9-1 TaxID=797114 RepID=M0CSZ0_9EURY|nr:metalloregulator ArsR/SmtB family transcription factor [Halosimplex carlsbadense]ELZ25778.1 ArsR family transcriptional regulator [Halosimplex carlsbadense 2-9-1]
MSTDSTRLRRLLAEELEDCCDADVAARIDELEALAAATPTDRERDLAALSTLSDGTRHDIVRYLAAADGELCVCELSPLVDVSDSAISHALSDLRDAGLVTRRKEGTWRHYDATDRAERLLDALDDTRGDR